MTSLATASLGRSLGVCGPIVDAAAAARARDRLEAAGWDDGLEQAWPALAPIFAAAPYLAALATRAPEALRQTLRATPQAQLQTILAATTVDAGADGLRQQKKAVHLLTALADLGGIWDLDQVTSALSRFADQAVAAAVRITARAALEGGRIIRIGVGDEGPLPGLICLAMGKLGAFELNYSSDIDLIFLYDPEALPLAEGVEPARFAARFVDEVASLLQDRTSEGYVFRVDLRLRPDPYSTPVAVSLPAAFAYYESVGQNWERAALIKARPIAADLPRGTAFLAELSPFIWRRNLDYAAIADIQAIKRQIHVYKVDDRLTAPGADLKLGRGGIREIEFFVQTQQLILGGRHSNLRSIRTLDALTTLAAAGHISSATADELTAAYGVLRGLEHRIQMVADEQTHSLPLLPQERRRVAALAGWGDLRRFDAHVSATLRRVNHRFGQLFADETPLSSRFGSLVFTGADDDPETLATLGRMGFTDPAKVMATIRNWHHGRIGATRSERGREAFTRLAPPLLEAVRATGAPDAAFARFADFFTGLSAGVQVQALFLAQPRLLELVVKVMAFAPAFARTLARRPDVLDTLIDPDFFDAITAPIDLTQALADADDFETAMSIARRRHREATFRIGVRILSGTVDATQASNAFTELADALISGLAGVALGETRRLGGDFSGDVAVIALGKCGSSEMNARSDLDLMTLYRPKIPDGTSSLKAWSAQTFYARFTQRLIAALSVPTADGTLYEVDLRLRPSGTQGPVAVSLAAFDSYYAGEAETWEFQAMTRARVVWATTPQFEQEVHLAIEGALRRPRSETTTAHDIIQMRQLMAREKPANGFWDMKLCEGGLVDIEFAAQHLQLIRAAEGGPLRRNTGEALIALAASCPDLRPVLEPMLAAWSLQQNLSQLLKIAVDEGGDPADEPAGLRTLLARAGGTRDLRSLKARLGKARKAARAGYLAVLRKA